MIVHQQHNSLGNHNYNAFFYKDCEWFYHFHKNYEITYVLSGQVEMTLNGIKTLLSAGDFVLIFPNEFHAYRTPKASEVWIGVFSADFVGEFAKITTNKRARNSVFSCEPEIQAFLEKYLIIADTPDTFILKSALYAVCREFLNHTELFDAANEKNFIYDIITYVSANFQNTISLETVAKEFGYEYHYLSRQFHNHFHMNFKQFLNTYRTDHARDQLLHSGKSITEIALSSGFQTTRTFNRVFQEQTGVTPSEFKKKHQEPHCPVIPNYS